MKPPFVWFLNPNFKGGVIFWQTLLSWKNIQCLRQPEFTKIGFFLPLPFKYYVSIFLPILDPPTLSGDVSNSSYPSSTWLQHFLNPHLHPFILQPRFLQFLEIWFEKSGWPEKKIRVCRSNFLTPLFYTFLEKLLQNKWSSASKQKTSSWPFFLITPPLISR